MSWSISFKFEGGRPEDGAVNKLAAITAPFSREQADLAVKTAFQLVASGAVGDPDGNYNVVLSGHANVKHLPTPGWANDCVSIAVYQV